MNDKTIGVVPWRLIRTHVGQQRIHIQNLWIGLRTLGWLKEEGAWMNRLVAVVDESTGTAAHLDEPPAHDCLHSRASGTQCKASPRHTSAAHAAWICVTFDQNSSRGMQRLRTIDRRFEHRLVQP